LIEKRGAGNPLIVGFIVPGVSAKPRVLVVPASGEKSQEVVIRVVGPSLAVQRRLGFEVSAN
jgi:hypothetical protein